MTANVAWILAALLLFLPAMAAQAPSGEQYTASPTTNATPTPTGGPPDENGSQPSDQPNRTGRPDGSPGQDGRGPPVSVEDAQGGFGARPSDPDSIRPAFAFNASRASLNMERAGSPALVGAVDSLIEFLDTDGDDAYDIGEPVVQRHVLADLEVEIRSPAPAVREAVYALPGNGTLTLRFHLEPATEADAAKFDVVITAFPFTDPASRVALGVRASTPSGFQPDTVGGHGALAAGGTGTVPYLSWVSEAQADGQRAGVGATTYVSAGDDGVVYWSYPQAASIEHDPLLGYVMISPERLGDALVFGVALGAGALALLVGFDARRRFRP